MIDIPERCPCCGNVPAFIERACLVCGKTFMASRNQLLIGRAKTCSRACGSTIRSKPMMSLAERFWKKVNKTETCWLWTAGKVPGGYGFIRMRGRANPSGMAHRISWEMEHGEIPQGMYVMHICDTPACVRPDHLRLGTPHDNVQDAVAKGRMLGPKKYRQNRHA